MTQPTLSTARERCALAWPRAGFQAGTGVRGAWGEEVVGEQVLSWVEGPRCSEVMALLGVVEGFELRRELSARGCVAVFAAWAGEAEWQALRELGWRVENVSAALSRSGMYLLPPPSVWAWAGLLEEAGRSLQSIVSGLVAGVCGQVVGEVIVEEMVPREAQESAEIALGLCTEEMWSRSPWAVMRVLEAALTQLPVARACVARAEGERERA